MMLVGRQGFGVVERLLPCGRFSTGKKNCLPATQDSSENIFHYIYIYYIYIIYICISFIQALDILYMPSVEYLKNKHTRRCKFGVQSGGWRRRK